MRSACACARPAAISRRCADAPCSRADKGPTCWDVFFKKIVTFPHPVVCAVEGNCMGAGVSLIAARDYVIAATDPFRAKPWSSPRLPNASMPLTQSAGGSSTAVAQPARPWKRHYESLARFADAPPLSMALLKVALDRGCDGVDQAIDTEADFQAQLYASEDHDEAARSFLEKRKPVFLGR